MSNPIDIIVSSEAIKGLEHLLKELEKSDKALLEMSKQALAASKEIAKIKVPSDLTKLQLQNERINESLKKQEILTQKLQAEIEKNATKAVQAQERQERAMQKKNKEQERATLLTLKEREVNLKANRAYTLLVENYNRASNRLQDLVAQGRRAGQTQAQFNAEIRKAQGDFQRYHARVTEADHAVKRFNRNVGNYPTLFKEAGSSLRSFLGAFGLVGGVYMFAAALKQAFTVIKENDKANADLAATMGVTRKEITSLTKDQQRLGASTKFTATEVAGLQKEYAKLGFSQREILGATEKTLALAAAVDTDLANAAMVAGSTLRAFNLDVSEMGRVTDVMAMAFTKSALDIENFRESMKYVAPIARATNVSIEKTTALLGILADNGIKGSQAGTSLRRILTDLAATGKPFNEAFAELQQRGITVADAFDEVGRNAQSAFLILANNVDKVNELGVALDNAGGAAQRMADEQLNSLSGKLDLLTSAWDGFILSLNKGDGMLSQFFKNATEGLTNFVTGLTRANETVMEAAERRANELFRQTRENIKGTEKEVINALKQEFQVSLNYSNEHAAERIEIDKKLKGLLLSSERKRLEQRKKEIDEELQLNNQYRVLINQELKSLYTDREKLIKDYVDKGLQIHKNAIKSEVELYAKRTTTEKLKKEIAEFDLILSLSEEKAKKAGKEEKVLIAGTVAWYQKLISEKKKLRDETALTTESYKDFSDEIEILEQRMKDLTDGLTPIILQMKGGLEFQTAVPGIQAVVQEIEKYKLQLEDLQPLISATFDLGDTFFERQISKYDNLIRKSNEYYDALISNAESGSEQEMALMEEKAKAEEDLQKKKIQMEQRQAVFRKLASVSEIAVNTAVAIMKNNAQLGFIAAKPINAITFALGAVQTATVLAQPIPQYAKGTNYHKGGDAVVGDGGKHEIIQTPDGTQTITPNVPTLIKDMPKGTKVIPDAMMYMLNFKQKEETNSQAIEKAIEKGFKNAKVNNYLSLPKIKLSHEIYKSKGL